MNNRRLFFKEKRGKNYHHNQEKEKISQDASGGGKKLSNPAEKGSDSSKDIFHGCVERKREKGSASDSV
jgi:hypothetical protein